MPYLIGIGSALRTLPVYMVRVIFNDFFELTGLIDREWNFITYIRGNEFPYCEIIFCKNYVTTDIYKRTPYSITILLPLRTYPVFILPPYVYRKYKNYIRYDTEIIFLPKPGQVSSQLAWVHNQRCGGNLCGVSDDTNRGTISTAISYSYFSDFSKESRARNRK